MCVYVKKRERDTQKNRSSPGNRRSPSFLNSPRSEQGITKGEKKQIPNISTLWKVGRRDEKLGEFKEETNQKFTAISLNMSMMNLGKVAKKLDKLAKSVQIFESQT